MKKQNLFYSILLSALFASNLGQANNESFKLEGFLEIPSLFGPLEQNDGFRSRPISLHQEPNSRSRRVALVRQPSEIKHEETVLYGPVGAAVYNISGDFYLLETSTGITGWYQRKEGDIMHSYLELLSYNTFLNGSWENRIFSRASGTTFRTLPRKDEYENLEVSDLGYHQYEVRILQAETIGNIIWVQVEITEEHGCETTEPAVIDRGWIKLHNIQGDGTIWTRSC